MSILSNGFKLGSINIDPKYVMTMEEIQNIASREEEFPNIFPIWCTDNNLLYIFYKDSNGVPNVCNFDKLSVSGDKLVLYPTVDPETNIISWNTRVATDEVPEPVQLRAFDGKSAYQLWLDNGNEGTLEDFFSYLSPDMSHLNPDQIENLKRVLDVDDIKSAIDNINNVVDKIINGIDIGNINKVSWSEIIGNATDFGEEI